MSGQLGFSLVDLYGHKFGAVTTRDETIPEASDQVALVDDQKMAAKNPATHDAALSKNILIGIAIIGVIIVLFSIS
ncbi:hypothetical protein [Lysinibacillus xylanilyticus]|uniref:hypothetical protein n=1 Tax=Lysinibacillus xylanilyticus TaxID=582475 RepID=UPI003D029CB5